MRFSGRFWETATLGVVSADGRVQEKIAGAIPGQK
jgi:hypothetical protein